MELPRIRIAKYQPDVFRKERRNIGVILWTPEMMLARFAGEDPEHPGQISEEQIPSFIASPIAYQQWVHYWRREIGQDSIRSQSTRKSVPRSAPEFFDAISQTRPSNYYLSDSQTLPAHIPHDELPTRLAELFQQALDENLLNQKDETASTVIITEELLTLQKSNGNSFYLKQFAQEAAKILESRTAEITDMRR